MPGSATSPASCPITSSFGDDGDTWVFVGWWRTMAVAKAAADAALTAPEIAPMLALIDFDSARYLYLHGERAEV
jgi:hypothetical protein